MYTGTSLGIKMLNLQGSGAGNDHAFDDIKVLDATPQLDKSFSPTSVVLGGTSTLTYTITNTSDLAAKDGWSFTDTLPSGLVLATPSAAATTCPAGVVTAANGGTLVAATGNLNAGQASCTVTVNVTSATTGTYTNDASNVTSVGLNPPGSSSVTFTEAPAISVVKSASPASFDAAGAVLHYSFLVTNTGNVTLTSVAVNDTGLPGLSAITCPDSSLAAGAQETCTATYTTTAADVDAGSVSNTATTQGTPPGSTTPVISAPSTATVPAVQAPGISVVKSASPLVFSQSGTRIGYSFLVTNTGNVTLTSVTVSDTGLPGLSPITCPDSVLAPGASETCTATYTTTAADVRTGRVTNTATAQGSPPGRAVAVTSRPSTVTVIFVGRPVVPVTG